MKKIEFSKIIVGLIVFTYIFSMAFAALLMWKLETAEGLTALIASAGGNLATVVSFYMWKAKNENALKIAGKKNLTIEELDALHD